MTQHITILSPTEVVPGTASVWRDDQILMWGFAPGVNLEWPLPTELPPGQTSPIWFTTDNPNYATWMGSMVGASLTSRVVFEPGFIGLGTDQLGLDVYGLVTYIRDDSPLLN